MSDENYDSVYDRIKAGWEVLQPIQNYKEALKMTPERNSYAVLLDESELYCCQMMVEYENGVWSQPIAYSVPQCPYYFPKPVFIATIPVQDTVDATMETRTKTARVLGDTLTDYHTLVMVSPAVTTPEFQVFYAKDITPALFKELKDAVDKKLDEVFSNVPTISTETPESE
jgi:hypothetical protein